ncbi:MAG: L-histidine N(alpha)-methyltransferase [Ginsengibacter sp.]
MNQFLNDVLLGLQSSPKYLDSKYFYDKKGDELFQKIMASDEYYLTNAEMEIFSKQSAQIADNVLGEDKHLDVIEFGPGDAIKSVHLLKELSERKALANYFPIDISKNIIQVLSERLPKKIAGICISGFAGEYLEMLAAVNQFSSNRKLVLFLGANIGNFKFNQMPGFCKDLRSLLSKDDLVLIGFDLKKDPKKILAAYDDHEGFTTAFNLNLLHRINDELGGNFDVDSFEHFATYDPGTGACKSYLISTKKQSVAIKNERISFEKDEPVFMEISQKYSVEQIDTIAQECGFRVLSHFFDSNEYFVDVILKCEA